MVAIVFIIELRGGFECFEKYSELQIQGLRYGREGNGWFDLLKSGFFTVYVTNNLFLQMYTHVLTFLSISEVGENVSPLPKGLSLPYLTYSHVPTTAWLHGSGHHCVGNHNSLSLLGSSVLPEDF